MKVRSPMETSGCDYYLGGNLFENLKEFFYFCLPELRNNYLQVFYD